MTYSFLTITTNKTIATNNMAYIKAISYYLPERQVTNKELLQQFPEWSIDKVAAKVGVNSRHLAASDETAGDMAEKAAHKLFTEYGISPESIDFIMLCTQSPDYFLPSTACILQSRLGIPTSAGAFDYNLGCSGCIYGIAMAKGLIAGGIAKNVLVLTAETYNKYLHPADKSNRKLYSRLRRKRSRTSHSKKRSCTAEKQDRYM